MYLAPHHFQAQSRYFEDSMRFANEALFDFSYGLTGCALDEEALANGTVSIIHARGIMPDGAAFHMPESDPLPQPRDAASVISPASNRIGVYLALPARMQNGANCELDPQAAPNGRRYIAESQTLHDDTTGQDEKPVRVGRKNLRLIFETEIKDAAPVETLVTLPIARVMRSSSGKFVFDPSFIPPTLQIGASVRLMNLLGPLVELMEEKVAALTRSAQSAGDAAGFSTHEIASFWFLHTVNANLSPLRHFYFSKRGHPLELYLELARLAGALCTFALNSHPRALPAYDHNRPEECFEALNRHIREHLELIIPANCLTIPLHPTADYFHAGEVVDERCFGRSNWYLAIRAEMGDVELIAQTPQLVKVCSEKFVGELVKRALPGLPLSHVPSPPPAIAPKVGTHYFQVGKSGPFWDHIASTRHVGIYVPGDIPNPLIQLLAVIEG
jgi:type VI secretion system protein ImpJ